MHDLETPLDVPARPRMIERRIGAREGRGLFLFASKSRRACAIALFGLSMSLSAATPIFVPEAASVVSSFHDRAWEFRFTPEVSIKGVFKIRQAGRYVVGYAFAMPKNDAERRRFMRETVGMGSRTPAGVKIKEGVRTPIDLKIANSKNGVIVDERFENSYTNRHDATRVIKEITTLGFAPGTYTIEASFPEDLEEFDAIRSAIVIVKAYEGK